MLKPSNKRLQYYTFIIEDKQKLKEIKEIGPS